MKKIILLICSLVLLFSLCLFIDAFADDISLVVDGNKVVCDVPPVISNSRTLVPARALFEHLDANVTWNEVLRQVIVTSDTTMIIFNIDSKVAYVSGEVFALDTAPVIVNDRTLIPVRFVSENLGYKVDWDNNTRTVTVKSPVSATKPQTSPDEDKTPSDPNAPTVSRVVVSETEMDYTISVSISSKVTPKVMTLSEPHRLIFDFYGVNMTCKDGKSKSYMSSIVETRWASHPDFTRVVVESLAKCQYTSRYSSGKYIIKIEKPVIPSEEPSTSTTPDVSVPKDAPVVAIDAGHGGRDPGAVGRDSNGNIILYEKDISLKLAKKVKALLNAQGVSVVMTRESDKSLGDTQMKDLVARANVANEAGASIFLSIHTNAYTNSEASGTCVLYAGLATNPGYGISGKTVAENIQKPLVEVTELQDRGVIPRPNIVVLKETVMPAVLVECAFISCPTDQKVLSNETKLDQMAKAMSDGIIKSLRDMGRLK